MKYFKSIAVLVLLLITAAGCNFLDETPSAHQSQSNYYKTASDARAAINDVYRQAHLIARYWYGKTIFGDIRSDNAVKGGGSATDNAEARDLEYFAPQTTSGEVANAWTFNYRGIYLANLVLSKVPAIDMDAGTKAEILSEAHFWRGYFYLQLVRLFGDVPLVKKPLKEGKYDQPETSADSIWTFIEQDADSAITNLPTRSELPTDSFGRITKAAAQSLLMNAYMWRKEWTEAEQLGDEIINSGQYSLASNYNKIWTVAGEFGSGSIFEINYANVPGKGVGNALNVWETTRATWGIGFVCPTQDLVDAFEPRDPRKKATILTNNEKMPDGTTYNTGPSPTGYYNRKYWLPTSQWPQNNGGGFADAPTNERVYRLAEIMLWDAEASVHNGDIAHATALVNKVRARARNSGGNTDNSILPSYKTVTLQNVYHEERVEEALGAHRRFYQLVRTGRAADVLHAFAQKYNTQKGANYKQGISNLIPIPQQQLDLSDGKLNQNNGY